MAGLEKEKWVEWSERSVDVRYPGEVGVLQICDGVRRYSTAFYIFHHPTLGGAYYPYRANICLAPDGFEHQREAQEFIDRHYGNTI